MDLRHIRCFIAVAEELHFARAAERLHIEQSPLSRTIKELENDLGVRPLERTTRRTELTWAGQVMLDEARRVFAAVEQARASVKSAAAGYRGRLRIALSDGIAKPRLAALLARCREEEPEVEIRLAETSLSQQIKDLRRDLFDAGFAHSDEVGDGITAAPVWTDPLLVAVPARHPLLEYPRIPLDEVLRCPLVLCHPEACEGSWRQIRRVLHALDVRPSVVDRVPTLDLMTTLGRRCVMGNWANARTFPRITSALPCYLWKLLCLSLAFADTYRSALLQSGCGSHLDQALKRRALRMAGSWAFRSMAQPLTHGSQALDSGVDFIRLGHQHAPVHFGDAGGSKHGANLVQREPSGLP